MTGNAAGVPGHRDSPDPPPISPITDLEQTLAGSGLLRPGVAVALGYTSPTTGHVTWAAGELNSGEPVTVRMPMYAASVTKQLIAVLAAQLVLAGRMDPRGTISELLGGLPAWTDDIRVHHLIHHTSGLPPTASIVDVLGLDGEEQLDNALVLRGTRRLSGPDRPPGQAFVYSNLGYVLLAEIVRTVSGMPVPCSPQRQLLAALPQTDLPELARRALFTPLEMGDSQLGSGHDEEIRPAASRPPDTLGDGGLWTTASDLLVWLDALNHDRLGTDLTRLVQTPGRLDDGTPLDYAWGVTARPGPGGTSYTHGGHWPGWTAKTVRRPANDTAVALLTTSDDVLAVSQVAVHLHEQLSAG